MNLDLAKINTATKYPSIPTYHELGDRGILKESGNPFAGYQGPISATEKIDGANARIIVTYDSDWLIGSRDELLTSRGDRVYDQTQGIVDRLRHVADNQVPLPPEDEAYVFFFEVYGQKAVKNYLTYGNGITQGYRLFDVATIPLAILDKPIEAIAQWRDDDGQEFWIPADHPSFLPHVPRLASYASGDELPVTIDEMLELLAKLASQTHAALVLDADPTRKAEGIVFRTTAHRHRIFKARWENYQRTVTLRASGS